MAERAGTTLIELIVVVAMLGIILGLAALNLSAVMPGKNQVDGIERCRSAAIQSGVAVRVQSGTSVLLCLPDGQVVGAGFRQLSGEQP